MHYNELEQLQRQALAVKKLCAMQVCDAMDPLHPDSRPTPVQLQAFRDQATCDVQVIEGGNQCLAKGTLVVTPEGPRPIEDIKPGDAVYNEFGTPIKVLKTFQNGTKEVIEVREQQTGTLLVEATAAHRFYDCETDTLVAVEDLIVLGALADYTVFIKLGSRRIAETYDIHVDSPTNLYLLANGLVTHNSGKSLFGGKTCAHIAKRDHPYIDVEKRWPHRITMLILTQTSKHSEEHWDKRMRPFFEPGTYREVRQSNMLYKIIGAGELSGKFAIYFFSYENPKEATARMQSFDAEIVWIDELCSYLPLYEEADRRVQAKDGLVLYTYTAKKPAPKVKKYVKAEFEGKKFYVFNAFDNPIYDDDKKRKIMAKLDALPLDQREQYKKAVLEGGWLDDEEYVYGLYDRDIHQRMPANYSSAWRHIEALDPAGSSKVGYILAAEDPNDDRGIWYVVKAKYIPGEAATTLLEEIQRETGCVNVYARICDPHESWFIKEARKEPWRRNYRFPVKKDRKTELIKGVSNALKDEWLYLVPGGCEELEDELNQLAGRKLPLTRSLTHRSTTYLMHSSTSLI